MQIASVKHRLVGTDGFGRRWQARLQAALFCLGGFSVLAQVIFTRELLVVFFGNELCLATILAGWLLNISAGALLARLLLPLLRRPSVRQWLLTALPVFLAVSLPAQVYAARVARRWLGVGAGEYASFGDILLCVFLVFLPGCLGIGFCFPLACATAQGVAEGGGRRGDAAGRVYAFEALGSAVGGAVATFVLLRLATPCGIVFVACGVALTGAALTAPRRALSVGLLVVAAGLCLSVVLPSPWVQAADAAADTARWRGFEALRQDGVSGPGARLVGSRNSIHQNLALIESDGQFALYGNGQVQFVFPDPISEELRIHSIMAQSPAAERVLLLGGNPIGDVRELLKYPLERLVHVELDPAVGDMVRGAMPDAFAKVRSDSRLEYVTDDAPRYVRWCRETFDVIIINAPEPTTGAANRFFTLEFYRDVAALLSARGFMCTAVTSSERLQAEAANLGASVYQTLARVFPVVKVTAEGRNRFFASGSEAGLTFDRQTLADRSRAAGIETEWFRPEYFLGADEIEAEKMARAAARFRAENPRVNTLLRPATYLYNLALWARYSDSGVAGRLAAVGSGDVPGLLGWLLGAGCVLLGLGVVTALRAGNLRPSPWRGAVRGAGGWTRAMVAMVVATTAFCGMALEVLLIFIFQGLYGYVYGRIGLIVAAFMAGLVLGAVAGRRLTSSSTLSPWLVMGLLEALLMATACLVPLLGAVTWLQSGGALGLLWESGIHVVVVCVGVIVGAEFPLANRLACSAGSEVGAAAAMTDAADHSGAAAGALLTGCALVPMFGIASAGVVLGGLKVVGLMALVSGALTRRMGHGTSEAEPSS